MNASAKVMLLGDIGVGKTSLARRLKFDRFETDYKSTIGVDIVTCDVVLPDGPLRLILWDTDGDFGMNIFSSVYLRGAAGAVIVADASRPATLVKMANLAEGFGAHSPGRPINCVINKIDLAPADGSWLSKSGAAPALLASAMTGEGVNELFAGLGAAILRRGFQ